MINRELCHSGYGTPGVVLTIPPAPDITGEDILNRTEAERIGIAERHLSDADVLFDVLTNHVPSVTLGIVLQRIRSELNLSV